ncbi:MAG: hypothetical protein V7731_01110 [Amphritea sp.]
MADLGALKKNQGKGIPPLADKAPGNTKFSAEEGAKKPLQFNVTEAVFDEFSEQAFQEFGFKKGAKLDLFMKVWRDYKRRLS